LGSEAGHIWYQGREGGDFGTPVPCSTNGDESRFNLVTDTLTEKKVLDLTFLPSDYIVSGRHYTTIQTADDSSSPPNPCCVLGESFPSNYYAEAIYRVTNTPNVSNTAMGGLSWAFWQLGQGLSPYTNPHGTTVEVDHPEQHGEQPQSLYWSELNWLPGSPGGGYFPGSDVAGGFDPTAYHTFGVRSTTDGSNNLALCSYLDGVQRGCTIFGLSSGQATERKYFILSAGYNYQCSYCISIQISRIYPCNRNNFCISPASKVTNAPQFQVNISGVTGSSNINGSWPAVPLDVGNDFILDGSMFKGTPTGGIINLTQFDLLIDSVRVWSCSSWATGPCYTKLLTGSP
jgi:hypothetical protein